MSSGIQSPPNVYSAGLAFNYSLWTQDTVLTLLNVPWNNDYRDIVRFASQSDLDAWINNQVNAVIPKVSMQKFNQNVRITLPVNVAMKYNYLRASNPGMPVDGDVQRNYYYFVTAVDYLTPETTQLTLQLDVWQTFGYEVVFGSCYVERGHIGIANANAFANYGRDYLTEPEGFDLGGEYRVVHVTDKQIINTNTLGGYDVLVGSTVDLTRDPGDFGTDIAPTVISAKGTIFQGLPTGAMFFIFNSGDAFLNFLAAIQDKPWVSQGIISVTIIPKINRYFSTAQYTYADISPATLPPFYRVPDTQMPPLTTALNTGWRDSNFISNILGPRYAGLKKFLTYPYMVLELTAWTGSPLVIKPEMWQDPDATVREITSLIPPGQRVMIHPLKYNWDTETTVTDGNDPAQGSLADDLGEFLDFAVSISSFPQIPVVNDMSVAYLAQNRNSIGFQFRSADWSQQRAMAGAGTQAQLASLGMENQKTQAGIANNYGSQIAQQNAQTTMMTGIAQGAGALVGGVAQGPAGAVGGVANAAAGIVSSAMVSGNQLAVQGLSNAQRSAATGANVQTAGAMRDTNLGFAQMAARGDYANEVAGIQAKVQDSYMTQPSVSGQFGGEAFNLVNNHFAYSLRWKMPNLNVLRQIGDYWLRYGYSVRQFVPIPMDFKVMSKFTYWKLTETYISQGPFPEGFKQVIRGIFEKGVTVWSSPDDIGVTDWADNEPVNGIAF